METKKISPNDFLKKITSKFTFNRKIAFFATVIMATIVYFQVYSNDIHNPDTLYAGNYHGGNEWEISLGRWGLIIMNLLRGSAVSTVISSFITIIIMGATSIVLVELLNIKKPIWIVLTSAIHVTAPTFAIIVTYPYCSDSYAIAMLLSVLSVYFIYKKRNANCFVIASCFVALSLGLYQSYIGVTVTLCVIIPILKLLKNEESIKTIWIDILKSIGMVILGVIIYYILTQLVLYLTHVKLSTYSGANEIGLSIFKTIPEAIKQTYTTFYQFFFEDNILKNSYWKREYVNLIFFLILATAIVISMIKNKTYKSPVKIIMIITFIAIMPIAINVIELIAQERTVNLLMGASLYLPFILLIAILETLDGNTWRETIVNWGATAILLIIIITYALSDQCTYIAREYTLNQAYSTMIRIVDRIETNEEYQKGMKICFAGTIEQNNYPRKSKIYEMAVGYITDYGEFWENYASGKVTIKNFLEKYMGIEIEFCTDREYLEIVNSEEFEEMEIFPEQESVKVINDIVVVKLSDHPIGRE